MRAKQFIKEIQPIRAFEPSNLISAYNSYDQDLITNNSKKLPGNNNYRYNIIPRDGDYKIYIQDEGTLIGYLGLTPIPFPLKKAVEVDYITVQKHYTGVGIAKALYGIALSIMKRPLVSGTMQSPGGRRNWLSLSKIPGVEVNGYISIDDHYFDSSSPYIRQILNKKIEAVMNSGAEYMGNVIDRHYFRFDVMGGDNQMKAVVNAVDLYSGDLEITPEIGMYAVWTGK
jgi:hypothetical protein